MLGQRLMNIRINTSLWTLSCPYPNIDVIILLNNSTNVLMYVNITVSHCYLATCFGPQRTILRDSWNIFEEFQLSKCPDVNTWKSNLHFSSLRDNPEGILVRFVSSVNKLRGQIKYLVSRYLHEDISLLSLLTQYISTPSGLSLEGWNI